jgi:hypothetical protein
MIYSVEIRVIAQTFSQDAGNDPSFDWSPVRLISNRSSQVGWYFDINADNSLNPPAGEGLRRVTVEFRARDAYAHTSNIPKQYGPEETLTLYFSRDVPVIENIIIVQSDSTEVNYFPNTKVSGNITIKAAIRSVTPLSSITLYGSEIPIPAGIFNNNRFEYLLNIPVYSW